MTDLTIRPLRPADTPALGAIINALAADPHSFWPPASWYTRSGASPAQWLADQSSTTRLVAVAGDEVVGHIGIGPLTDPQAAALISTTCDPASTYEVVRLFVAPSARRLGVASALLTHATDLIVAMDRIPVLGCFDEPAPSPPAALYHAHGWKPVGSGIGSDSGLPFTCYWLPPRT